MKRRDFVKNVSATGLTLSIAPGYTVSRLGHTPERLSNLRCEYLNNPLSIDTPVPRLSWEMLTGASTERSLFQSAYRVLVASSADILGKDHGDLWDSGKVRSDAMAGIAYEGIPLSSRAHCYWKVQIWDQNDRSSGWSPVSQFVMGLLNSSDWKAKWITCPSQKPETTAHFGYLSSFADTPDEIKWVQIDLGSIQGFDAIRLWGTWMTGRHSVPGGGFSYRFKIEVSENPDFSNARIVFDHRTKDFPNPGLEPVLLDIGSRRARLIRLTATKLSGEYDPVWDPENEKWKPGRQISNFLALSEMEVLKNGQNVAYGKSVTASDIWDQECFNTPVDSIIAPYIHGGWSPQYLTNGRKETDLGSRFHNEPVYLFRKEFTAGKRIRSATLYATALGAYEFSLNGKKTGDHQLAPAWTIQSKRILYQTFDVTKMLNPGTNVLSAMLGDGWFRMRGHRLTYLFCHHK